HLWYHSTQSSARNANRSLYFDGDTIFSYGSHFPIAKHVSSGPKMSGNRAVLFTTRKYSVTTSGHCSAVRSSIPASADVFEVPNVELGQSVVEHRHQHAENLTYYVETIAANVVKSARARSSWAKQSAHGDAQALAAQCELYCAFFNLALPKIPRIPG